MTLKSVLSSFEGAKNENELTTKFRDELAPVFLFGGYIKVNNDYRIYIHTVEFYYHEEEGLIKDPIVYHRDNKYSNMRTVAYFPIMSLHAHASGYDISFENPEKKYRASALIRAYEIYDEHKHCFLELTEKGNKIIDDRSTFLYDYLNGFTMNGTTNIIWVDEQLKVSEIKQTNRKNVFCYDKNEQKLKARCPRQWSFSRTTNIKVLCPNL